MHQRGICPWPLFKFKILKRTAREVSKKKSLIHQGIKAAANSAGVRVSIKPVLIQLEIAARCEHRRAAELSRDVV